MDDVLGLGDDCYAVLMHDGHIENCAIVRREASAIVLIVESAPGG